MALTIDFANKIIYPDRADMTLIQSTPIEIYQLDLNALHQGMRNLEDDEEGIWADVTHDYASPTTLSGVTYARLVEIINSYTITFLPDSAWVVQVTGGNSNVGDRVNPNNVSVQVANSAGLQDAEALQAGAFGGQVALDVTSSFSGTAFPTGTREFPVNNSADALLIAQSRGLTTINTISSMTLGGGDWSAGYQFISDNPAVVTLTIDPVPNVQNCVFENITITGTLDGNSVFRQCAVLDITYVNGFLFQCAFFGTIILAGGSQATIMQCYSGIPGGIGAAYPIIDMGGSGQGLALRSYSGGIGIINGTGASDFHSLDFVSGRVVFDGTVTAGNYSVRGNGEVVVGGSTAAISDDTTFKNIQASAFAGAVAVDPTGGTAGTDFPSGTREFPVDNMTDALTIAVARGIDEFQIMSNASLSAGDFSAGYVFKGDSIVTTTLIVGAGSNVANCEFDNFHLEGVLDGTCIIRNCEISSDGLSGFNGSMFDSSLEGIVTLSGGVKGEFFDCSSGVPGATGTAGINMGGSGQDLVVRDYSGGLTIYNGTGALVAASIDVNSGQVKLDPTVTAGTYTVRGNAKVTDNSTGTSVVNDDTVFHAVQVSSFHEGQVTIDSANGTAGDTYPQGTSEFPIDNLADALLVANRYGLDSLHFVGDHTFTTGDNVSLFQLTGQDQARTTLTFPAGVITAGTGFADCTIAGQLISPTNFTRVTFGAVTGGTIGLSGTMNIRECIFTDTITLSSSLVANINIIDCATGVTPVGTAAIFDANGADVSLVVHDYHGDMDIRGFTHADAEMHASVMGDLTIGATNTAGTIEIHGEAHVLDSANGGTAVIDRTSMTHAHLIVAILENRLVTVNNGNGTGTMTLYEADLVTVMKSWTTVIEDGGAISTRLPD